MLLTDAGFEELAAYPLVHADGLGHLLHVGPCGLTQGADAVDAADSLGQEGIGSLHTHRHVLMIAIKQETPLKGRVWLPFSEAKRSKPILIYHLEICIKCHSADVFM